MQRPNSWRPSAPLVMSLIALFVALGGSSYAAIKVTGKNVKDSSLTGKDIKNSSLGTSDVKNGSLLAGDFKSGQLPAGPQGPRGLPGQAGQPGAPGISGLTKVSAENPTGSFLGNSESHKEARAVCPEGKRAISSGAEIFGGASGVTPNMVTDVVITQASISDPATVPGYVVARAIEEEPSPSAWKLTAWVLCANVS